MVARAPLTVVVDRMTAGDLPAVHEIERQSFSTPWPEHAYKQELEQNKLAHYLVARYGERVVGFAGIWLLVDEAHITTFATRPQWRRQGVAERLLIALLDLAVARGANEATLEVRPSNAPAIKLYEKFGFRVVGVRPRYYTDNNEDALIMTTPPLEGASMIRRIGALRDAVAARPDIELGDDGQPVAPEGTYFGTDAGARDSAGPTARPPAIDDPREPRIIRPSSVSRRAH